MSWPYKTKNGSPGSGEVQKSPAGVNLAATWTVHQESEDKQNINLYMEGATIGDQCFFTRDGLNFTIQQLTSVPTFSSSRGTFTADPIDGAGSLGENEGSFGMVFQ